MLKNYLKIAFRNYRKNKSTAIITIGGFALSLAVVILLSSYIAEELSVDMFHKNLNNIYQVVTNGNDAGIEEFKKEYIKSIPGINKVSYYSNAMKSSVTKDNKTMLCDVILCDEEFFDIFSINILTGNPKRILENRSNIILSKSFVEKFFGGQNPIGKIIKVEHEKEFVVAGIFKDLPKNSSIQGDAFSHTESRVLRQYANMDGVEINYSRLMVLLNPNSNVKAVQKNLSDKLISMRMEPKANFDYKLFPFKDAYFNTLFKYDHLLHANINLILLITGVTFIVLLLSVLNYVNLTLVINLSRLKEFGIKKTTGAGRKEIFRQVLIESFLGISISVILGFILIEFLHPLFVPLLGREVNCSILFKHIEYTLILMSFIFVLAVVSGIYPAYKASKIKPVTLMKYNTSSRENSFLRNILSTVQFVLSSILIICLIIIYQQTEFLKTKDLGFNYEQLLKIDVHHTIGNRAKVIKEKLLLNPDIKNVTITAGVPGQTAGRIAGGNMEFMAFGSDEDFAKTFNIPLIAGRPFMENEERVCIINETALKEFDLKDWENTPVFGNKVVGIIKDFNHQSLYTKSGPVAIFPVKDRATNISVKISSNNIQNTIRYMKSVWTEVVPDFPFMYSFYDEWVNSLYMEEERNSSIIKIFAIIAIFIALLGLYGTTELSSKKRIKEISIRKVLGAEEYKIAALLNIEYLKYILIAFIIACPIAYYLVMKWLEKYPYRTEISWYVFVLSGIIVLSLAVITTGYRIIKFARMNPVEGLRYE